MLGAWNVISRTCFSMKARLPSLALWSPRTLLGALKFESTASQQHSKLITEAAKLVLCLANVDFFRELNNQARPVVKLGEGQAVCQRRYIHCSSIFTT